MGFDKMKSIFLFLLLAGAALPLSPVSAAEAGTPLGLWLAENHRSVIRVEPCAADSRKICGEIFWIIKGGMQFDSKNPDPAKHNVPMCGLGILAGFVQQDATHWGGGNIYKADEGDTYHGILQLLPNGTMLVRGYIGMPLFGKSQIWTPVSAKAYPRCRAARAR